MPKETCRRRPKSNQRLFCVLGCAVGLALALALAARAPGGDDVPVADRGLFDRLDTNGDGRLEAGEVADNQRYLFARLLRQGDENGDGALDRDEWLRATEPRRPVKPLEEPESELPGAAAARLMLLTLDSDRDGQLTRDEAPKERLRWFDQLVERFDENKDDRIDRRELARGGGQIVRLAERLVRDTPEEIERQLERFEREQGDQAKRFDVPPGGQRPIMGQGGAGRAGALFRQLDTNGDGFVELDEVPARRRGEVRRWLRTADRDADDRLSLPELRRALLRREAEASQLESRRPREGTRAAPAPGTDVDKK